MNSLKNPVRRVDRAKALAWKVCGLTVRFLRTIVRIIGRRRRVDVIIYKVDRLGDWLLAEPAITRVLDSAKMRGEEIVVWAASESSSLREWRKVDCSVVTFALEPRGLMAKLRRALTVIRLLAVYQTKTLICLRHAPEPIRDFVLDYADARNIHALSWLILDGPLAIVPHEILRHHAILTGVGLEPPDVRALLPRLSNHIRDRNACIVIAPFSSAAIKDWQDESWCSVADGLIGRSGRFELWVGSNQSVPAQRLADKIARRIGVQSVLVRTGTLAELGDAIAGALLILSVDTFAAHLAAALDKPLVVLIGGGQYGDFGPWQRSLKQRWLTNTLPCFGCDWLCVRATVECLGNILPETVLGAIDDVLEISSVKIPTDRS